MSEQRQTKQAVSAHYVRSCSAQILKELHNSINTYLLADSVINRETNHSNMLLLHFHSLHRTACRLFMYNLDHFIR